MLTPRLGRLCLAVLLLLAPLLTAPAAHASLTDPLAERRTMVWHNKTRIDADLVRLRQVRCLKRAARTHARRQADQQRMFHQPLRPVMERCGLRMAGENVAVGYELPLVVHRAWMLSPGHRANILERRYRLVGVARARGANGVLYWAVVFGRR